MTVIGAGVTLHEALAAAEVLKKGEEKGAEMPRAGCKNKTIHVT